MLTDDGDRIAEDEIGRSEKTTTVRKIIHVDMDAFYGAVTLFLG
jgi:hypothetical protein